MPKVVELMKSVGFGTKIVCAHFINLLVVQLGKDIQPYAGRYRNRGNSKNISQILLYII